MLSRRKAAVALGACLATLVSASSANAYVATGSPWPKSEVTYTTKTSAYAASVDRAAAILNATGINVRFRRVASNPDITFIYKGPRCDGSSYVGYHAKPNNVWLGAGCSKSLITLTAVHEMGHVLGLDHEDRRCARMNSAYYPDGTPSGCGRRSLSYWLKHPLLADDIRGLRALY
ncbi:MAG: Astacin [Thermoleophilales bacterium]|nr:Astacin [Thermoleophilales bacterium]